MSEDKKKEIIMVEGLGEVELLRAPGKDKDGNPTPGVYTMSQKNLEKFYEEHGVPEPKKVFKAIDEARTAFVEAGAGFLKPHVIEDHSDYELRAGQGSGSCGRHIITVDAEKSVRNVSDNTVTTKYGVVGFKVACKAPMSDTLTKLCEEMAAGLRPEGL